MQSHAIPCNPMQSHGDLNASLDASMHDSGTNCCSGCQLQHYCGEVCQHRHWDTHQLTCGVASHGVAPHPNRPIGIPADHPDHPNNAAAAAVLAAAAATNGFGLGLGGGGGGPSSGVASGGGGYGAGGYPGGERNGDRHRVEQATLSHPLRPRAAYGNFDISPPPPRYPGLHGGVCVLCV